MVHKMPEKFAPCQHGPIDWVGIPLNGGIKMHQTHTLRCHQTWLEDPSVRSLSQPSTSIDRRCSSRDDTGRATLRDRDWKVLGSAGRSRQGHRHQPPAWSHSPHLGHGWDPWAQNEENLGSKRQKFGWIFSLWVGNSRIFPPTNIDPCQLWVLEEYFSSIGSIQGSMLVFRASHLNLLFLFRYWRYWLKINDDHKIIWCFIHKRCHKQNRTTSQMFGPPSRSAFWKGICPPTGHTLFLPKIDFQRNGSPKILGSIRSTMLLQDIVLLLDLSQTQQKPLLNNVNPGLINHGWLIRGYSSNSHIT